MTEKEIIINFFEKDNKRKLVAERFYAELESMGITHDIGIWPNTHREEFEFRFKETGEKIPQKVYALSSKYAKLINQTCVTCGKKTIRHSDFYCGKCFLVSKSRFNYNDISDLGFTAFSSIGSLDYRREFFYWTAFSSAEFIFEDNFYHGQLPERVNLNLKQIRVIPNHRELLYDDTLTLYDNRTNYYSLLKCIPDYLLLKPDRSIKIDLIDNLDSCEVCGYNAVLKDNCCLVCGFFTGTELTERQMKKHISFEQKIKSLQLEYYQKKRNRFIYPKREPEFQKSRNYKLLITKEELKEYNARR